MRDAPYVTDGRASHGKTLEFNAHDGPPIMVILDGGEMDADAAAWSMIADAAAAALTLPGLSPAGSRLLREAADSCRFAAGLPPRRSQPASAPEARMQAAALEGADHA